jgi:hypothetical protein
MMHTMAIEVTQFEIDEEREVEMLTAHEGVVTAVRAACPGLIDARLYRGGTAGGWIDVWSWESLELAEAAAETAMALPEAAAFFSFITSPPSMVHGTLVAEDLRERA